MCRPCQKDGGIPQSEISCHMRENADNIFRYAGVCKGRVFLASVKFNPVRECGPGFRKNLIVKVCGFSARFVVLSPEWQKAVMSRYRY